MTDHIGLAIMLVGVLIQNIVNSMALDRIIKRLEAPAVKPAREA